MHTHGNIALEDHKVFPFIAWAVFIGFALFVGSLAVQLYQITESLSKDTAYTKSLSDDNSMRLDDLEVKVEQLVQ